ncbi:MAG TPA: UvrD-helicase domain-containing protein [Candidatus Binataceae bacterium]|jgi:DNA helicase-2/ATP-dependent DNA helicase PcrA|nr:UvrD-helicase domain-containing protein [Candidatus Binataceae bacterium]
MINLDDLNPAQRDAVLAPDGPILILAGAGSGKTRVLTHRIAYLIAEGRAAPAHTLAVTFTNKAAAEMRERIAALLGGAAGWPWVSTFHSACARILRHEAGALGYRPNFSILDEGDAMAVLRRVIEEAAIAGAPTAEAARARIEQLKNEGCAPQAFTAEAGGDGRDAALAAIYRLYQERLRAMNAMDFSDLLLGVHQLFERDPAALLRWQGRAEHLLVDEYQDTNRVQYLLVRALSARTGNLCVVGDEDQSIYRWRGADIRNILDFERDFPHARIFKLEQNYRSTKTILAAADAVIRNNRERKAKRLWTENEAGEPVTYLTAVTERDEAEFIAREIGRLCAEGGVSPSDIVVFYRVNAQARVLEEALVRRRVPYYVVGGLRFYEHREVKDLLAYLRALANPADAISVERMVGAPPRGVGAKTLEAAAETAAQDAITLFEALGRLETNSRVALRAAKQAGELYGWMHELAVRAPTMKVRAILDEVITRAGFAAYLDGMQDAATRRQNVAEMLSAADAFDAEEHNGGLADFLERVALVSDADQVGERGGRVALMTLHTSKGLEYPVVFIAGMEEGLFPHFRSQDETGEVEEERRLCYVGMTRARRLLYLTNTLSRELYGQRSESRPSRFLGEIDPALVNRIAPERAGAPLRRPGVGTYIDYSTSQLGEDEETAADGTDGFPIGARVVHQTFGRGVVRRREGRGAAAKAWVHFERSGTKLLVLKFANLRPVAE